VANPKKKENINKIKNPSELKTPEVFFKNVLKKGGGERH
jgi:hypothetical protein